MNRPNQPVKRENIPASNTPDQRPPETAFSPNPMGPGPMNPGGMAPGAMNPGTLNPNAAKLNKGKHPGALSNTPTQPGKYFTGDQNPGWKPGQMGAGRNLYPGGGMGQNIGATLGTSMSTRLPQDGFMLAPSADNSGNDKRSLNPLSKDFKPKTQQVQEYLKKEEMKLPSEFMDTLITTLNMTGTEQIHGKAIELESQMKDEYIEKMAHFTVVKRVIDADEKRIDFYSQFFYSMKNKKVVRSLIKECIHVILRIITNELAGNGNKNEISRAASNPIKNVSTFLGHLTLRNDRPLLTSELDLKQLLIEAEIKK